MSLFVEVYKADLEWIAIAERARLGNEFEITVNVKKQEICYKLDDYHALIVWFTKNEDNVHFEVFYHIDPRNPDAYGECFETSHSFIGGIETIKKKARINYESIPREFYKVIDGYSQYKTRDKMRVDEIMDRAKKVKRFKPFFFFHPVSEM